MEWMYNLISIVNNFNLVIYTDENTFSHINFIDKPKIKFIIKPLEEFYNYKYKDYWIENHKKNSLINESTSWELNMLWSEKIWFVKETIERKYFDTLFYGWCDIGYFRNRTGQYVDTNTSILSHWPNKDIIASLDKEKIVYACINNDIKYINYINKLINNKSNIGLPKQPLPPIQQSIAGGFFLLHKDLIEWWSITYDSALEKYLKNNYLVKDDQIILADCIFTHKDKFKLFRENNYPYDNWFMFQRILS